MFKLFPRKGDKAKKISKIVSIVLRLTLVGAVLFAALNSQWTTLFLSAFALAATFLPYFIEEQTRISFPIELIVISDIFVYVALFLGIVQNFYQQLWWWDVAVHTSFGVVAGLVGFLILYVLYARHKLNMSPFLVTLFAFSFAVMMATVWEFFEYASDSFFGTTMQNAAKTGVDDTMIDLLVGSAGAFVTTVIGYIYIKYRGEVTEEGLAPFARVVEETTKKN